jgi:hypothetical protein
LLVICEQSPQLVLPMLPSSTRMLAGAGEPGFDRSQNTETTMKAVAIQAFGGPEGRAVIDLPDRVPLTGRR